MQHLSRTPPRDVLLELRQEVGFCCPQSDCGSPYLTWHHFDPPWRIMHHHNPDGMVALCHAHADKADNGSFTDDQIRKLKREGKGRGREVRGRFDWMRRDLLAVVGGNFYYRSNVVLKLNQTSCISFDRDEDNYLLLNFRMPTMERQARARIDQNTWCVKPNVHEVICPPSGRLVEVKYNNGDKFRAEFFTVESGSRLIERYRDPMIERWTHKVVFPLTVVELWETASGTSIEFGPRFSRLPGNNILKGAFISGGGVGLQVTVSQAEHDFLLAPG